MEAYLYIDLDEDQRVIHLMGRGDLLLVILVHWLGTFINTPAPPSGESEGAG